MSISPSPLTAGPDPQNVGRGEPSSLTSWLADQADPELLLDMLHDVIDPELGVNIVDLGLVYDLRVDDGVARVQMTMTTPACPLGPYLEDAVHACLVGTPGVQDIAVDIVWTPPWNPDKMMTDAAKDALGWRR